MSKGTSTIQLKLTNLKLSARRKDPPKVEPEKTETIEPSTSLPENKSEKKLETKNKIPYPIDEVTPLNYHNLPANKNELLEEITRKRSNLYESIMKFPFNMKRTRILSNCKEMPKNSNGIVYWTTREQRVEGFYLKNYI
jgi:hypothetical protein